MSSIKIDQLAASMLKAAQGALVHKWPEAKDYAANEFVKIGQTIAFIESQRAQGGMSEEKAKLHLEMQKNSAKIMLLTLDGLGILVVEAAINAALDVVRTTVNSAIGFVLI